MNCRIFTLIIASLMCLVGTPTDVQAAPVTINFDGGTVGNSVGATYAGLGVTFSNATFSSTLGGAPPATPPNTIVATVGGFNPLASNPIVATFSSAQSMAGITGIDVGADGIRIDAYDAAVGGTLVATQQVFGVGAGVGTFFTIGVAAPSILRVEFYQAANILGGGDGVVWDNFTFDNAAAVPEPTSMALFGLTALGFGASFRRRRNGEAVEEVA